MSPGNSGGGPGRTAPHETQQQQDDRSTYPRPSPTRPHRFVVRNADGLYWRSRWTWTDDVREARRWADREVAGEVAELWGGYVDEVGA